MKHLISLAALLSLAFILTIVTSETASAQNRPANRGFVDANGDGVNDNAADDDGDGIPNGQDPDFVRNSGTGTPAGKGLRGGGTGAGTCGGTPVLDGSGVKSNARRGK